MSLSNTTACSKNSRILIEVQKYLTYNNGKFTIAGL